MEVLEAAAEGLSLQATAARMFVTVHTVKDHRRLIMLKLGATNIGQAVAIAYRRHLLEMPNTPPYEVVIDGVRYVPDHRRES